MIEVEEVPFFNEEEVHKYFLRRDSGDFNTKLKVALDMYGFVVVTDLLDCTDIRAAEAALGRDLLDTCEVDLCKHHAEESVRLAIKGVEDVPLEDVASIWPGKNFVPNSHGVPQGQFAWTVRTHTAVKGIYEILHEGEGELVVGMDQPFYRPKLFSYRFGENYDHGHSDHNYNDVTIADTSQWRIFQSIVSIWPSNNRPDWTTMIWPGSHKTVHPRLMLDSSCQRPGHFAHILNMADAEERDEIQSRYRLAGWRIVDAFACVLSA